MKKPQIIAMLLVFLVLACNGARNKQDDRIESITERDEGLRPESDENAKLFKMTNDSLWSYLIYENGGCLNGGQYIYDGEFGGEKCIMSDSKAWEIFFLRNKKMLTTFLIDKITDDGETTKIHVCPFFEAVEGEVAIYALQRIHGLNWFDFDEFMDNKNKEINGSLDNHQVWLQSILADKGKRKLLINCWCRKLSEV